MVAAGVHIMPLMPPRDVNAVATEAERLGYGLGESLAVLIDSLPIIHDARP